MEIEVNDNNFEKEVIEGSKEQPVIVDFWADWCVPCHMLSPILGKVVESYDGKIKLAKVNLDESPNTSRRYNLTAIPAIKLFKNGQAVGGFIGVVPETTIKNLIDENL